MITVEEDLFGCFLLGELKEGSDGGRMLNQGIIYVRNRIEVHEIEKRR